ncbi:chaperone [Lithospermum erythrorhizon]|uniref:peptidylprolyl isomerase n=1 Tax=Lithospermum erythrorhizon TaxID=34254 RepID=A0AAV3Q758_LITER
MLLNETEGVILSFHDERFVDVDEQIKVIKPNKCESLERLTVGKIQRRSVLQLAVLNPLLLKSYDVAAATMPDMQEPDVVRTVKFPSGVKIQEIVEGEGPKAREGDLVEINYVCRRSNGYFVHSTVDQFSGESAPVILPLGDKEVIQGLNDVLIGMRVGGKRRALIPPSVGYVTEDLKPMPEEFGPRRSLLSHAKEQLIFEVQLLKIL